MKIEGSTFIVSGGASGLGRETTLLLNKLGAKVVVLDRNEDLGLEFAKELGDNALYCHADVTNEGITISVYMLNIHSNP